ncbi:MAG: Do family serine endopeptidase [Luteibaculaceae bacterium]
MKKLILPFAMALVGGIVSLFVYNLYFAKEQKTIIIEREAESVSPLLRSVNYGMGSSIVDFVTAAENSVNTVVHIKTQIRVNAPRNPLFEFFFDPQYHQAPDRFARSAGSGVIVSPDGFIVTNNHVIENAEIIEVVLNNNKSYDATIVGTDPSTDLAVIKIEEKNLPAIVYGNSDNVQVGEWVLAVGNPFNLTSTVTAGIVSAKARSINIIGSNARDRSNVFPIESFIQTDAAVNPGNSGGALVDIEGRLVGINTAIASKTGSYSGYSFAIPVNLVKKVVDDMIEFGRVQRAFIGVNIIGLNQELAANLGTKEITGVYIRDVTDKGAAQRAGLKAGDVIKKVAGVEVRDTPQLQEQVSRFRPGDVITVAVNRDGKNMDFQVELRNENNDTNVLKAEPKEEMAKEFLGAQLLNAEEETLTNFNAKCGVRVRSVGPGNFKAAGIPTGFIITKVDNTEVCKVEDVIKQLRAKKGRGVLVEGILPDGRRAYYGIGL